MLASESQNLLPALELTEAVYRGSARQLPAVSQEGLAQRAARLAAGVRFALDEPTAMRRLHSIIGDLRAASGLDSTLLRVLNGALSLMEADFGTLQLRDPVTGSLWLVTEWGFGAEFLDYFALVNDGHSACGRAAQAGSQTVISDVSADAGFAPHRGIAAAAGFRAVVSTPLTDYAGRLIGVVSTHFARSYSPPARELTMMGLYGDAAGEAIAGCLGLPPGDSLADPVGPAVLTALLSRAPAQAPEAAPLPRQEYGGAGRAAGQPDQFEDLMSRFAADVVHRLFSVGLNLDSARSIAGDGPAADRVVAAAGEVDDIIRDIRTTMFSPGADTGRVFADRRPRPPGARPGRTADVLDGVVSSIFDIGLGLQAAAELPGADGSHVTEALRRLDDMARALRDHMFAEQARPSPASTPPRDGPPRPDRTTDRAAVLRQRLAQTARSLQMTATGAAALLEQADRTERPRRTDYRTEIKRWRVVADQAEQIANRWEQPL